MSSSSYEGPNPLRPYYIPPSVGLSAGVTSSTPAASELPAASSSTKVFGSSARDLLPEIDYSDYLEQSPSVSEWLRDVFDRAVWRYTSTLTAQPFEVAKTILQTYVVPDSEDGELALDDGSRSFQRARNSSYDDAEDAQSSDDESSYFTSAAPMSPSSSGPRTQKPRHHITDRSGYIPGPSSSPKYALTLKSHTSLMEVLSQLWTTSGPTAPWKASSTTFIYNLLLPTLNTFIRSLLSAIVGLPEEDIASSMTADILTAASPAATLILSFISSALSAVILSPIDTARTFLILSPATRGPRSLLRAIRLIPTPNHTIPPHLVPITILHSSLPNFILTSTPLFLKSYLSIDPILNPSLWNLFAFLSNGLELAVRFPLETVLRRAQIATFTSPSIQQKRAAAYSIRTPAAILPTSSSATDTTTEVETIVPTPRSYRGITSTMWSIVYEEGHSPVPSESERAQELLGKPATKRHEQSRRRGQGIQGLYRGWRVGMWGIVGIWGASLLGAAGGGGGEEETVVSGMSASRGRGRISGGRF